MSTHEQIKELLTDFALRELPQQQSSEVKQHLADCQECRTELKKLQAVLECADSMRELPVDEQVVESAKESLLEAVANEGTQPATPGPTVRLDLIWSTIMKSRLTKLAAAAVIIIAILAGLPFINNGGPGIALADVLEQVEKVPAFIYKMKMTVTGEMMPGTPARDMEQEAIIIISKDLGMKMEMTMTDSNSGEQTTQIMYLLPEEKAVFMIMPELKKYIRMELTDELLDKMKMQNNDPRLMIRQMVGAEYTKLGPSVIDGVAVEGFKTTDPAILGGMMGDVKVTLWVDSATKFPILIEMDMSMGEQMRMKGSIYGIEWDVPVVAEDFVPDIPHDFEPLVAGGMKMPSMNEEGAIEGLKIFAELAGKYPEELNMMTLMQLASELRDAQSPAAEKIRKKLEQAKSDEERVAALMEIMQPIQSVGLFYMMLVADGNDPAYYGDKVTPEFPHAVLMRWRVEEDKYRVIFGDLTVEDVTADELAELEAAPLNIKPTAIRPQPEDGASVAFFADVDLSWMPGAYVNEHKVYFGTSADQMTLLAEVTDSCSVTAPALEKATTYYWCVDEVQPDGWVASGDVWSFNTGKLVGFWELDGDANDSSGSGNHGTIVGEPNLVTGKVEDALQFDGIDDHIRTNYATDLPVWTVAIWVKSPVAPKKAAPSGPVHREKNLQISWNHSSADFRGVAGLRVANQWYAASFGELKADQWYHLAATYDGENLRAYTNGVLITDNPDPSGPPDKESATLKFAKHANYGDHFKGTIDDIRLYSYALTADEVAAIYADLKEEK